MLTPEQIKEFSTAYYEANERKVEVVLEALCRTIKNITGVYPNDKLRDALYYAIQFDV